GKARHIPEDRFWRKDGSHFPVEYACSPLRDDQGGIVGGVVVFRDISARQRSEEASRRHRLELAHRDRLDTLGAMAAGIAHEINQPLTAIAATAQACIRLLDAGLDGDRAGRLSDALAHIALQAQRGGDVIREVRQFVKQDAPVKTAVDINALIEQVLVLIRPQAQGAGVRIHTQFAPDLPRVWAQDIQIQQVLLNLATNALDAMSDPGLPERCLTIATEGTPGQVEVVVQDTGAGVDPALRTEIFKQFVTSKRRGMGLGLSISKGILDAHGGSIVLEATGSTGTRFRFSLAAPGA
ncbi:MAG: PAS domain S-box protein, partial [Chromatiaceae bacterium]|nr:PAS domain S-box protein [Chromatiaceae bacterium]